MSEPNTAKFNKLVTLLHELFQLDQPDLDFGIYRIMHAEAGDVTSSCSAACCPKCVTLSPATSPPTAAR